MSSLQSTLRKAATIVTAAIAAISIAGMAVTMFVDVLGRYIFNRPVPGAAELIELLVAITVFSAFPLATATKEHIRLDYLEMAFRRDRQHYVRAANWIFSAVVLALIAWRVAITTGNVIRYGDTTAYLHIPLAPFGVFITAMIAASALVMAYLAYAEFKYPDVPAGQGTQI